MKHLLSLLLLAVIGIWQANACTTAVISGKYTKDGRPMIWKLRDTESFENKMMYFTDGKYPYIGMINSNDEKGEQVWGGSNSAGFAIMNSASFNVNMKDTISFKDQEGKFMKLALQQCASLEEFEQLIKERRKPMGLAAHFGVLDADGNIAFYEVNNQTFTKFDANDPAQAPNGYILRTNHSFTGKKDIGYGFIRLQTAQDIFYQADACGNMSARTVIQNFSRCLKHPVLKRDFRKEFETVPYGENFVNSGDLITRHGSSSMIMIEGVKEGEATDMATIWAQIGFPNTSVVLPVWVKGGKNLPKVLLAKGKENCPLNAMALELKNKCYPISRSAGYKYLKISELINAEKSGIIQKLEIAENRLFRDTETALKEWRSTKVDKKKLHSTFSGLHIREKIATAKLRVLPRYIKIEKAKKSDIVKKFISLIEGLEDQSILKLLIKMEELGFRNSEGDVLNNYWEEHNLFRYNLLEAFINLSRKDKYAILLYLTDQNG